MALGRRKTLEKGGQWAKNFLIHDTKPSALTPNDPFVLIWNDP